MYVLSPNTSPSPPPASLHPPLPNPANPKLTSAPASTLSSTQSTFQSRTTTLRYIATNGLRFFLQFWYAKRALFYIPKGWAPWYAEWMLSFPRAPRGSVSVQVWGIACASVIALVGEAVIAGFVLWASSRAGNGKVGEKGKMEKGEMKFKA